MSPDLKAMVAPFAEEELHTRPGAGGKQLTYIEDETVMDRLDIGFGQGNWSVLVEPIPYVEGVVKVRLGVRIDTDGDWVWYEDFGYCNNKGTDTQALKEAVTDGIRRCGRYLGIARDLYRGDTPPQRPQNDHSAPAPRPAAPVAARQPVAVAARSSTDLPPEPDLGWDVLSRAKPEPFGATAVLARDVDGTMTYGELADRAKAASVPIDALAQTSKKLFGEKAWKLTALTDVQRYAVAIEAGLA